MAQPQGPRNNIGIARGSIQIGLENLKRQREIVVKIAQDMNKGIKRSFRESAAETERFEKALDELRNEPLLTYMDRLKRRVNSLKPPLSDYIGGVRQLRGELLALTAVGTATTLLGVNAADNLQNLRIRFREIAGDQERGLQLMEEIGEAAQGVNLPIRQTQEAFAGLVPAIRQAGGEVDEYINLVARLATINPREGVEGAVFAIREALSSGGTDLISLSERFNLPRRQLRELIEETGSFGDALDIALNQQGATNEALASFSGNLQTARTRLRDVAQRGLERAFLPQLDAAIGLVNNLASGIDAIPDGILQIGAAGLTATTAMAGLSLGLSQAAETYNNLKKSGAIDFLARNAGRAGRAGVLGGAAFLGANIGVGLTNAFGRATGNEHLANASLDDVGTTLNQSVQLIGFGVGKLAEVTIPLLARVFNSVIQILIEKGRNLARSIVTLVAAITNPATTIPAMFDRFRGEFEVATGQVILAIGHFVNALQSAIPGANPELEARAQDLILAGEIQVAAGNQRIQEAITAIESTQQVAFDTVDEFFDALEMGTRNFFMGVRNAADSTKHELQAQLQPAIDKNEELVGSIADIAHVFIEQYGELVDAIESDIQFQTQLNQLSREGTVEQVQDRIAALQDEASAISDMLPQLEAIAPHSSQAADALANYQGRLLEINNQIKDLAQLTPELVRRAMADLGTEFTEQVREIEAERQDALNNLVSELNRDLADLDTKLTRSLRDARKEEIEAVEEFQDAQADIVKAHQERLLEIERKGRESILDAAARLDAAGVFAARRARRNELREADKRFEAESERNEEKLEDTKEALTDERQEILQNYADRRQDLIAAAQQERSLIQQNFNAQLTEAQTAYQHEVQLLQQANLARLSSTASALKQEDSMRKSAYGSMLTSLNNFLKAADAGFKNLAKSGTSSLSTSKTVQSIGTKLSGATFSSPDRTKTSTKSGSLSVLSRSITRFQEGGVARFGGSGEALAFVRDKERILTPQQTASFDRLVNAMSGSQGAPAPDLSNLSIDITGVDSFEDLVERVTRTVLGQVYQQQIAGA